MAREFEERAVVEKGNSTYEGWHTYSCSALCTMVRQRVTLLEVPLEDVGVIP